MGKKVIKVAAREKWRMVNAAVGKNFFKTVTEPLTNSDSTLKRRAGVAHAAGLVDELMKLKRDQRVDTSELKTQVARAQKRQIILEVTTAGSNARVCRVVDAGLGMTAAEPATGDKMPTRCRNGNHMIPAFALRELDWFKRRFESHRKPLTMQLSRVCSASQCLHWIYPGGTPGRHETRRQRDDGQDDEGRTERERIARAHLIEQAAHQSRE